MEKVFKWAVIAVATFAQAAKGEITAADAKKIALAKHQGTVEEVESESYKGEAVYSVEIKTGTGTYEVFVRRSDGKVLGESLQGPNEKDENDE